MVFSNSWVDTVVSECVFKLIDAIFNLLRSFFNLFYSSFIKFVSLFVFELKLTLFSFFFVSHVLFPVFNTFLKPFFHKTSVSLKFIDLGSSDFLFYSFAFFFDIFVVSFCLLILSYSFVFKFSQMIFHIHCLLWFVESLKSCLKELALHLVV